MKTTTIFLASIFSMITIPTIASAQSVIPYPIHRETLDNGLRIIVIPMPSDGLVSYWTVMRTGSRDEVEKGVTGFAHFFEHMMFHGGKKYPKKLYDQTVSSMGADSNASTWDDKTAYHLAFAKEDLETVVDIEADRFQNLQYEEGEFKTEAGAVYGEYNKGRTSPFEVLYESIQNAAFDVHTYKHTTIGFESDIVDMPNQYNYSKTFFERFYRPENAIICIAGDVEPKAAIALVKSKYAGWKKGYVAPKVDAEPLQQKQRRVDVAFEGQTLPILAIGFKGESFQPTNKTMLAGKLIDELCFGETSPLYKKLVLEEQRVEQFLTDFDYKRDPGLCIIFAVVKDPADVANIEKEIMATLADVTKNGVAAERLKSVVSRGKYGFLSSLSTPSDVNERLAPFIALTGDIACVDEMFKTRDLLTSEDIKNAAKQYFTVERSTVATLRAKGEGAPPSGAGFFRSNTADNGGNLANGNIALEVANDPNMAFKCWIEAGSQNDPPGKEGLAALTAAMISEGGTKELRYDQILEMLFPLAAGFGGSVDKEMTVFSAVSHRDHATKVGSLFSGILTNPGFRKEDFERLRDRAVNAIEKALRYSSDEELAKAVLYHDIFDGTPYASLTDGTVAGLKSITLEDVIKFYKQYYTKDNIHLAAGGTGAMASLALVRGDFSKLPSGNPAPVGRSVAKAFSGRHLTIVDKPGPSATISFGFPIELTRASKDFAALSIARSWLGEHRNSVSHLYQVIREARGLNYGDYAYIEAFPNGGSLHMPPTGVARRSQIFEVWVRAVPRANTLFALRAALGEVDKLVKNGMTAEDFTKTRDFLMKYSIHYAETTEARLGYAIEDRFYGQENYLKQFRAALKETTLEDVNRAIQKYLQMENIKIAIVSDRAAELRDAAASDAPSPPTYASQKSKEIEAEDRKIERFPLQIPAANIRIIPVDTIFEK